MGGRALKGKSRAHNPNLVSFRLVALRWVARSERPSWGFLESWCRQSQSLLFCSFGVEPSPTAEIVSGCILAAPLFLETVPQKGQYRGFRGYSPNRSIKGVEEGPLAE